MISMGIDAIALTEDQLKHLIKTTVRQVAKKITTGKDADNYFTLKQDSDIPVELVIDELIEEFKDTFEIYQDSKAVYFVHGATGRESLLGKMREEAQKLEGRLIEINMAAALISKGSPLGE